jgi:hypothetical protein
MTSRHSIIGGLMSITVPTLVMLLVVGSECATINASSVPTAFKTEMTSLLSGLKIGGNVKQDMLDSLMVELINLYVMLLDFHEKRPVQEGNINKQVGIILNIVDNIKQSFVVESNVIRGSKNMVIGDDNVIAGKGNAVKGDCNTVVGVKNVAVGSDNTVACENAKVAGSGTFVVGRDVNVKGNDSVVFSSGKNLQVNNQLVVDDYSVNIDPHDSTSSPRVTKLCN